MINYLNRFICRSTVNNYNLISFLCLNNKTFEKLTYTFFFVEYRYTNRNFHYINNLNTNFPLFPKVCSTSRPYFPMFESLPNYNLLRLSFPLLWDEIHNI